MRNQKGFTLIELLVVIALIGILAGVVLVVIDPLEQFARGRDAARKSAVRQMVGAVQAYYTTRNASYPPTGTTWLQTLVNAGELKSVPAAVPGTSCAWAGNVQNGFCYGQGSEEAIIYVPLESKAEKSKCATGNPQPGGNGSNPFFLWSSYLSKSGVICATGDGGTQIGYLTQFTFL